MGSQTIIHGRIILKGNVERSQQIIRELKDTNYPIICSDMFSSAATDIYSFYEEVVVAFAATYKSVEDDWDRFILKFEYLLRSIEFNTAKLQMETEYLGDYHFFWKSKTERDNYTEKDKFIEMPEWYFGYGFRGVWGYLEDETDGEQSFPFEFEYPVRVDDALLNEMRQILRASEQGNLPKTIYPGEHFSHDVIHSAMFYRILTYLSVHKELIYGYDQEKGRWIRQWN